MNKAGDKGISVGEKSILNAKDISISNSSIGIASKDFSEVKIKNLNIENVELGLTSFQKKMEFGPSSIIIETNTPIVATQKYLLERNSAIVVNGKTLLPNSDSVKDIIYPKNP